MPLQQRSLLAILENLPVAVMVADREGRIVFSNTQAINTLGHPVDHITSIASYARLYGFGSDGVPLTPEEYPLARALRGEAVPPTDYRYRRPDGTEVWLRAAAAPVVSSDGITGASVLFRNVDSEREAAVRMHRLEETLREQAAALRDADRRKDQFLAALSHELRNPLGAMASALQVLGLQEDHTPASVRALSVIQRQLAHISRLVEDLLEVSRISEGKIELRLDPVDPATFVTAAVETVRPQIDARQQTITVDFPSMAATVRGDEQRLTQVLVNLLINASKYTDERGKIRVTVQCCQNFVEIVVRDNGIGIPLDMQPRIFDLFSQVDDHRQRSEGGLGLGLSLVQRLTDLHGGTVTVQSEGPGRGSEFVVRLPALTLDESHSSS
jgi:signal transduction histidine kinase